MNYEEAFRHYREGTATEEEKAFVLDEIAKAKALSSLLDDEALAVKAAPIKEADAKEVKEAKHQLAWKRVLAGLLSVAALLIIIGAVLGGVFGAAASYAKDSMVVGKAAAAKTAEDYAFEYTLSRYPSFIGDRSSFIAEPEREIDERFNFEGNLRDSYYTYEIEVEGWSANGFKYEYEISVNSKTGSCVVIDFDIDRD